MLDAAFVLFTLAPSCSTVDPSRLITLEIRAPSAVKGAVNVFDSELRVLLLLRGSVGGAFGVCGCAVVAIADLFCVRRARFLRSGIRTGVTVL